MTNGNMIGLLLLYVDERFHFGEDKEYNASVNDIFDAFEISPDKRLSGCFNFLRRTTTQLDDISFVVDQKSYVNDVKAVFILQTRRAEAVSTVTAEEMSSFMSLRNWTTRWGSA